MLRSMLWAVCMVGLAATLRGQDAKTQEEVKAVLAELKKFQGTWKVIACENDGDAKTAEKVKAEGTLIFDGDKVQVLMGEKPSAQGKIKLDLAKSPKHLDIILQNGDNQKTQPAIYAFEGDMLKICGAEEARPKTFQPAEGSKAMYLLLKKEKSK